MIDEIIFALLSDITTHKVYADVPPDKPEYPSVVYSIIDSVDNLALDESGVTDTVSRIQIDVRAKNRADSLSIADSLNDNLSGYRGEVNSTRIDLIKRVDRRTIATKENEALGIYRLVQDYIVHH